MQFPNPPNSFLLDATCFPEIADYVPPDQPNNARKTVDQLQKETDGAKLLKVGAKRETNKTYHDTQRVLRSGVPRRSLSWALKEFLQNTRDHSLKAIALGKENSVWYAIEGSDRVICIGKDKKACAVVSWDEGAGQMIIAQFGRTLDTSTVAQGCETKRGNNGSAGGFGDGYKSAMEVIIGSEMLGSFEFYNAKKRSGGYDYLCEWKFEKGNTTDPRSAQKRLCVDMLLHRDRQAYSMDTNLPIMVTRICIPRNNMFAFRGHNLKAAMANALGSFVFMYRNVDADSVDDVYLSDDDRWVEKSRLVPLVPSFGGTSIKPDTYGGAVAVFGGIFYSAPYGFLGNNTVVFFKGKGLAEDAKGEQPAVVYEPPLSADNYIVFTGPDRDVWQTGFQGRFTDQVARFLQNDETRDATTRILDRMRTGDQIDSDFIIPRVCNFPSALGKSRTGPGGCESRMLLIARELKRAALVELGSPDDYDADEYNADYLDAITYVSSNDYAGALYYMTMLSDPPPRAIRIDADRANLLDNSLYPTKSEKDFRTQLTNGGLDAPFCCDLNDGPYSAVAKYLLGEQEAKLYVARLEDFPDGYSVADVNFRFKSSEIILSELPPFTKTGLETFTGEAVMTGPEKQRMTEFMSGYNDAVNLMPNDTPFAELVARGLRIAACEEVVTAADRHRAAENKLSVDERRAAWERMNAEFAPPRAPSTVPEDDDDDLDTGGDDGGDDGGGVWRTPPSRPRPEPDDEEEEEERPVRRRITTTHAPPRPRPTPPPAERIVRIVPVNDTPGRLEPPVTDHLDQRWNEEARIYTPDGEAPVFERGTQMTALAERVELMDKACALIEEEVPGTDMQRVRYTWSPAASWEGLHQGNRVIYVNLALLPQTLAKYLGVLIHEAAHDFGNSHDVVWGRKMQDYFEVLLDKLLERAERAVSPAVE